MIELQQDVSRGTRKLRRDPASRSAATWGLVALVLCAVLVAACSSSDGSSLATRPLSEILTGSVEMVDLTANSASVRVDTAVDVVCSVVYGTDTGYGNQSTDPDMGGLPHTQHRAPLRGLLPDTLYHYRLQGTGADGTVYVSDDLTFRTPAGDSSAEENGQNVASLAASARVAEVSSTFGDSSAWAADNAIDDDPRTEWSSAGDGNAAFISIDLAETYELTGIGFWTRTMGSSAQITRIEVVTEDGTKLGPFEIPDASRMYVFPVSVSAQRLRFDVLDSSGGNTGAVEIAAFVGE